MESWDSKIPFSNFFELGDSQPMYGKLRLYILQLCACKMDNFCGCFLVIFTKELISHSANITALEGSNVLVGTEGEDTIDHYEISYAVLNVIVYVFVEELQLSWKEIPGFCALLLDITRC